MFRLEKIFQVNDSVYINLSIFWKTFAVFLSIYIFSILEFNSIFDLLNYDIYKTSKYFYLSIYFSISYLLFSFALGIMKKKYVIGFFIFLLNDIIPFLISVPFTLYLLFLLKIDFNININILYLLILIIFNIFIFRKVSDYFRARPDKRQQIDDWYKEMGSDSAWARGFLDDMIDEAERAPMSLEELAAAELSRVGKKPYSQSSVNRYLSNVAGKND